MDLRTRVLAGMAVVAVVLVLGAFAITRTTEARLVEQVDVRLRNAQVPVRAADLTGRPRPASRLSSLYVGAVTAEGVVPLVVPDLGRGAAPPAIEVDAALASAAANRPFTVDGQADGTRHRVLGGRLAQGGTVAVALPLDDVDDAVDRLLAVVATTTAALLALLALVTWWVVHLGIRPVKSMTATASAIAAGDLSSRVPEVDPGTEAGQLGIALNQMLGRIEEAFDQRSRSEDRLRRFVADASHELRTPLATVRGYAELHRTGGLTDPDDLANALRRTELEAVRMGTLVDDLLLLARLDEGRPLEVGRVDLVALAVDAVGDAKAREQDRPIEVRAEGRVTAVGDGDRLAQVVVNLVGNALVHTGGDTPVVVEVRREDGRAVLEVGDEGPGMSPEAAARAFERFYRVDPSRSRARGGSGLGLAIVEAIVAAHGGEVGLTTAPGRGTVVRVTLPIASPPGPVPS